MPNARLLILLVMCIGAIFLGALGLYLMRVQAEKARREKLAAEEAEREARVREANAARRRREEERIRELDEARHKRMLERLERGEDEDDDIPVNTVRKTPAKTKGK